MIWPQVLERSVEARLYAIWGDVANCPQETESAVVAGDVAGGDVMGGGRESTFLTIVATARVFTPCALRRHSACHATASLMTISLHPSLALNTFDFDFFLSVLSGGAFFDTNPPLTLS